MSKILNIRFIILCLIITATIIQISCSKPSKHAEVILETTPTITSSSTKTVAKMNVPTPFSPSASQRTDSVCDHLYHVSLNYLADTVAGADKVAKRIAFLGGKNESASLVCGPLSVSILKEAGILPSNINLLDIWLLCPREGRKDCDGIKILNKEYFPPQDYDYYRVYESTGTFDFVSHPLQPGDWMYLFTNNNGFDHMLTVTRVDDKGVAYTITNLNRGKGFIITEEVLYDPNKPSEGLFYELTSSNRGELGMSGTGGFLLVRKKNGICNGTKEFGINYKVK